MLFEILKRIKKCLTEYQLFLSQKNIEIVINFGSHAQLDEGNNLLPALSLPSSYERETQCSEIDQFHRSKLLIVRGTKFE